MSLREKDAPHTVLMFNVERMSFIDLTVLCSVCVEVHVAYESDQKEMAPELNIGICARKTNASDFNHLTHLADFVVLTCLMFKVSIGD